MEGASGQVTAQVTASATHLLLIPSYNTGPALAETVRAARQVWAPVWVVIDGSTDGSDGAVRQRAVTDPDLRVLRRDRNGGKGAAVLHALRAIPDGGFTHVLVMDADGQHPAGLVPAFMAAAAQPDGLVLGDPVFGPDAPRIRVIARRLCNALVRLETGYRLLGDSLFGFRVYPVAPLRAVMEQAAGRGMRGFDFDPEALVRLCWRGIRPLTLPAPVRYFRPDEGGVSHFRYLRDNVVITAMHLRLLAALVRRGGRRSAP